MTPEHIAAIKARVEKATAGPWKPVAQGGSSTIVAPVLPARNDRRSAVSYGYRDDAGYCIGYPFLYQPEPFKSEEQTRMDFVCFSHADADFIAHARTDIPALIAALEAAEAERDTYCAKLVNLADAEVSGLSWGGFNIIGDEKSVKAVQSAVHYSGQIEEYRTAFADHIAALEAERDALKERENISDELMASQYRAGAQAGWNAAQLIWPKSQEAIARLTQVNKGDLQHIQAANARRALEGKAND